MTLDELINYAENEGIINLVDADILRNEVDTIESKEKDLLNAELRIEQLEDKLLETTDVVFKLRKENEIYKKKLKRWKELLKVDGCNTKHQVLMEIIHA